MGIPGADGGGGGQDSEMKAALNNDNHSPASADEPKAAAAAAGVGAPPGPLKQEPETAKPQIQPPPLTNGNKDDGGGGASSEDVDILADDTDHKPPRFPLPPQRSPSSDGKKPQSPEADLTARLRRLRVHVLNALLKHTKSGPFRRPVDARALGIYPVYHQVIRRPMDLGTIRQKMDRGEYTSRSEAVDDIFLVWRNAKTFNAPGHFVHEAANILEKITKDKLARLERDEANGLFDQPQAKPPQLNAPPPPRPERRVASRKASHEVFLPGETPHQPQQLKKKYVENLSDQLRQCDTILKELLKQPFVEPFLRVGARYAVNHLGKNVPVECLDLYQIQQRMQSGYYRHPLHFAGDIRRIVTETYRYGDPVSDPVQFSAAADLQHNFEVLFSKRVDFDPVENPASYDNWASSDDGLIEQLLSAQTRVAAIESNVAGLLGDLIKMKQAKIRRGSSSASRRPPSGGGPQAKKKRGRPPMPTATKAQKKAAAVAETAQQQRLPCPLTVEESLALRAQVSEMTEEQQQRVVQIMLENNETLTTDANGYTEIDLGSCSARTVQQIQAFISQAKVKKEAPSPPKKKKKQRGGRSLSDSSDSDVSSDDSSSSSSSDSDSD